MAALQSHTVLQMTGGAFVERARGSIRTQRSSWEGGEDCSKNSEQDLLTFARGYGDVFYYAANWRETVLLLSGKGQAGFL